MTVDLSHHLGAEAKKRIRNPMKVIWRVARSREGLITLANGDPHETLHCLSQIDFHVPSIEGDDVINGWRDKTLGPKVLSTSSSEPAPLPMRIAMQYSRGVGTAELCDTLRKLNEHIHSSVPHNNVTLHVGNADGVNKVLRLLADPDDAFMAEEFSYPGLTHAPLAFGVRWVPIKCDKDGLIPEELDIVLGGWDEKTQGRRPHVLYTIPCGQNPTGSTIPTDRRKKIYALAQKHDFVIVEDDPYYYLQFTNADANTGNGVMDDTPYLKRLLPSFISMDTDGRVIRLDSFSKIIAPGMRLGWFTSHEFFQSHLEALTDSSVQHPHGMGQLYAMELLTPAPRGWGMDGFVKWVEGLSREYQRKRDLFLGLLQQGFGEMWGEYAHADVPVAGMFVCLKIGVEKHSDFKRVEISEAGDGPQTNTSEIMEKLFNHLLDGGLVAIPGTTFALEGGKADGHILDRANYLRVTFAGTDETIHNGVGRLVSGVRSFFGKEAVHTK